MAEFQVGDQIAWKMRPEDRTREIVEISKTAVAVRDEVGRLHWIPKPYLVLRAST